ncbi:MAG: transaldolase [Solirubrobacterales bacterium]|nr:transaldolase [Solirubrobacterales bacterium]MCB8970563.1 transaldolase [Thermoleophilales bacterium]MCO5325724.1 transaldolase [Solirubrobacterales bacterium]
MSATKQLHDAGQSIWLDYITRDAVDDGTIEGYVRDLDLTGLTSNPTIFDQALAKGDAYDDQTSDLVAAGKSGEDLFFELALTDLRGACDIFSDVHARTDGVDGWASLEVSPLLAHDARGTAAEAARLHGAADRENLFIKIPGTAEGLKAIEETIYAGTPVNVTLLFDADQYVAQAEAYMRGVERRVADGLNPNVGSVASLFVSRWDVAVNEEVEPELHNRLGIAAGIDGYVAYRRLIESDRWLRLENEGARPQRFLFASTGTKDPALPKTTYVDAFAAPLSVDTMPEETLLALSENEGIGDLVPGDGGDNEAVLAEFRAAGVDLKALAQRLQDEGADKFVKSWESLLERIEEKSRAVAAG